jgi:UDP-glucose 4-epimerase
VPTVLGFDPRLQFVHERDGLEVLWRTTLGDYGGTFNIAGDGVVTLSQAVHRAGRPAVPVPQAAAPWVGQALRRLGLADFSAEQVRFLSYGRVVDTTRMREVLGFEPRYTTRQAFDDFVAGQKLRGPLSADVVRGVEARLVDVLSSAASRPRSQPRTVPHG